MVFIRSWPSKLGSYRKAAAESDLRAQAEALATKLEPAITKLVEAYLQEIGAGVQLQELVTALESGDVANVLAIVAQASAAAASKAGLGVAKGLQDAVWAGGAMVAPQIPVLKGVVFDFDRLNPKLVSWLQEYHLGLIKNIDDQTREAVRDKLVQGMSAGKSPLQQATRIKEVIGLTPRQAAAVSNYRAELESWHEKKSAAGYGLGSGPDQVNGHNVFKPGPDGTPLDGVTQRRLRDRRYDGVLQRALDERKPLTPEQINKQVAAYQRKYLSYRAQTIARTESLRATNVGVQDGWRQAVETEKVSEDLVRRLWIVTGDDRVCPICAPIPSMNKGGVAFSDDFDTPDGRVFLPPIHPSCVAGDTEVTAAGRITAASKRPFAGEVCVLHTESGKQLTVTPNHPVLSRHGWIAAGQLNEGDDLACGTSGQGPFTVDENNKGMPPHIAEIFEAAWRASRMTAAEVPGSAKDFHGDGIDGQVNAIATKRPLRLRNHASLNQHGSERAFIFRLRSTTTRLRGLLKYVFGSRATERCCMCGSDLSGALSARHSTPLDAFLLARRSQDIGIAQNTGDSSARDALIARQFYDGVATGITAEKIVKVERIPFSGHVYNLETEDGFYLANGLVVHNCRCTVFLTTIEPGDNGYKPGATSALGRSLT